MSIPEHRYFRRGRDGTRVLEHAEVRELFFVAREAGLALSYSFDEAGQIGTKFKLEMSLTLSNTAQYLLSPLTFV